MKVNPNRKPGMEPRRQLAVNTDNFLVTATTKPAPNVMPCIPTDLVGTTKRESIWSGYYTSFIYHQPGLMTKER